MLKVITICVKDGLFLDKDVLHVIHGDGRSMSKVVLLFVFYFSDVALSLLSFVAMVT